MATTPSTSDAGAPTRPHGPSENEPPSPLPTDGLLEDLVTALKPMLREAVRTATREGWEHRAMATILAAMGEVFKGLAAEGPVKQPVTAARSLRRAGSTWEVVFDGRTRFTIPDSMGARYIDHLLHHPNVPIPAWELEQLVSPEKKPRGGRARQRRTDGASAAAYRARLIEAGTERDEAQRNGDWGTVAQLDAELERLEGELTRNTNLADAGERARNSVRKAIDRVRRRLRKGGPNERAFVAYLGAQLHLGYEVLYTNTGAGGWN